MGNNRIIADLGNATRLAAASGSALVNFLQSGTGAVARTLQAKMRDVVNVDDFGAVGNDTADDTAAITAATTAVSAAGGGVVHYTYGKTYKITAALPLLIGVRHEGYGAIIKQYTGNIPIFKAPTGVVTQKWSILGLKLRYNTQQTIAQTGAASILLADGGSSYDWVIRDVQTEFANEGIKAPATASSFAFVGVIESYTAFSCTNWAIDMECLTGGYTNISVTNAWALQLNGAGLTGSKGFRFKNGSMLRLNSMFADHITGQFMDINTCTGSIGEVTLEGGSFSQTTAGVLILVGMANSPMIVNSLKFVGVSFTTTGAGEIYMFRPTSTGTDVAIKVRYFASDGCLSSGSTIYEVAPGGTGIRVYNETAVLNRTVNLGDFAVLKKIRVWNGDVRVSQEGGKAHIYGTAAPVAETWAVGDIVWNTSPTAGGTIGFVCTTAGTPGAWKTFGAVAA